MKKVNFIHFEKKDFLKTIIIILIYFIINFIFFSNNYYSSIKDNYITANITMGIISIIVLIALVILNILDMKIQNKFLVIASILGIMYLLIIPLGNGNDEIAHFLRIFEISEKYTSSDFKDDSNFPLEFESLSGFKLKNNICYNDYFSNYKSFTMSSGKYTNLNDIYWNAKLYAPVQYIPQVLGVTIGRIFSDNILVIGYIGRIFGFLFWLIVCYLAILILPDKKLFFTMLCLLPINIVSAVCLSGDTVTNSVIILFVAIIFKYISDKTVITHRNKILICILSCLIALCKIIYLPFVFLLLLLHKENFNSKKEYLFFTISIILISIILGTFWFSIGLNIGTENTKISEQINYMLTNPIGFITITIRTVLSYGEIYILQFTSGSELYCDGQIEIYRIISYLISLICIFALFIQNEKEQKYLSNKKNALVIFIILLTICLIIAAEYVQWTSQFGIGYFLVLGIQGRYFIPVSMLLLLINNKITIKGIKTNFLINWIFALQITIIFQTLSSFL